MATHYEGTIEARRALDAFVKLVRAGESVGSRVNAHLVTEGISVSQFGALEALLHLGPMCQKDLGAKLLKSGGNITMVVDNLEERDFVARVHTTKDRRMTTVHLTEQGRALIERLFPIHVREVVREMAALDPNEQAMLGRLCRKLGRKATG